jgi:ADP-ribose pyrophosphatase YjhB (NUDIX family)
VSVHDGWRHCPRCGCGLRFGPVAGEDRDRLHCPGCDLVLYENAAPTASAVVVDAQGRVMLTRRALEPARDMWDLPGGFVEAGEHPEDAVRRELREETGLAVELDGLLGIWCDRYGGGVHTLNLHYLAHPVSGAQRAGSDVSEIAWFAPESLPARSHIAFENCSAALAEYRRRESVKGS